MKFTNNIETLTYKQKVTENIYYLKYTVNPELEWKAGQYVGIQTAPNHRRAYTIIDCKDGEIEFLIDVRPGGIASKAFEAIGIGEKNLIIGPYGRFFPKESDNEMVLIATGTGIAPYISWFQDFRKKNIKKKFKLIFGCRTLAEEIGFLYFQDFLSDINTLVHCITRDSKPENYESGFPNSTFFSGRVTQYLEADNINKDADFYICGNDDMVDDCVKILKTEAVENIFVEKYG